MPTLVSSDKWLGPYRLCLMLASGGMATVYLARSAAVGMTRFVAIKKLKPHLARDPVFVAMFADEAQIASQIQHPNVCSVYDFGVHDDECFLAMEYLNGEPLTLVRRALSRNAMLRASSAPFVARLIADACEGLHCAHELRDPSGKSLRIVHRDVSLDNLFLTYEGVVKVVDFGIASAQCQKHRTRTGILKGKFAYMQPETLNGKKPDRRADVWGLGVVMWELLTSRRLFHRATDAQTLRAVMELKIPRPSSVRKGIPAELDAIVMRALERDPKQRYPNARELGRDLLRFLAQHRRAVGLADLSDWMDRLFPGGRDSKRQLAAIASRLDDVDEVHDARPADAPEPSAPSLAPTPADSARVVNLPRSRRALLAAALGVAVLIAGVAAWHNARAGDRTVRAVSEPQPVSRSREVVISGANPSVPIELGSGKHVLEIAGPGENEPGPIVVRVRPVVDPAQ
jgi:serine/threonine-protein kinase